MRGGDERFSEEQEVRGGREGLAIEGLLAFLSPPSVSLVKYFYLLVSFPYSIVRKVDRKGNLSWPRNMGNRNE